MKPAKGFTVIELMVVLAITAIVLAMAWGPVLSWYTQFRFEAAGRSFINGAHAARMQAIGGLPVLKVSSVSSITKSSTTTFTVNLDIVKFICDICGSPPGSTPTKDELPIKADDYVSLVGFNSPDYFNGNLFRVIRVNPASPTVTGPTADSWGHKQWQVTGLSFVCESCADDDPSKCLEWTDAASSYSLTAGKVQVTACLKFLPNTVLPQSQRAPFSVIKNKTGSTIECYYDPNQFQVDINGVPVATSRAIVFDIAGATRNHVDYLIEIRKLKSGAIDQKSPSLSFRIDRNGRIGLGQ